MRYDHESGRRCCQCLGYACSNRAIWLVGGRKLPVHELHGIDDMISFTDQLFGAPVEDRRVHFGPREQPRNIHGH